MVTIADVARHAGVSPMTVSNVLNDRSVRDTTRQRVVASMEVLGYRVNMAARSLRAGRTNTIGFAVAETSIDNAMTSPPNRSVAVQDVVDRARADGAEFVTWFETNKSDGDWRLTPYAAATTLWDQLT